MKYIKKFNESAGNLKLREVVGTIIGREIHGINKTDKGVYTNFCDMDLINDYDDELEMVEDCKSDNYISYLCNTKERDFYLLYKDNKPYILSSIPGDDRGSKIKRGLYTVVGHDGSYSYNLADPMDFDDDSW